MKTPTLYLIHGWTYTTEPWTKTLDLLRKNGLKVEMLSVPGLTTPSRKIWTIDDYLKWADSALPDGAVALGHSNGGRILLNLAVKNPDKLKHLILLNSAGIYHPSLKTVCCRRLSCLFAPLKKLRLLRRVVHKILGASDYSHAPANMKKTLTHMLDSDRLLDPSKVKTSTTLLWGEQDTVTPLSHGQLLHQKLPSSTLQTFPNWNHAPYISDPKGLVAAILKTMKELN